MGVNLRQNPDNTLSLVATNGNSETELLRAGGQTGVIATYRATISRTDTTAKTLFTLPAGAIPVKLSVFAVAGSNAGTSATISVGKSGGTGTEYLNGFSVLGAAGQGQNTPNAATNLHASVGSAAQAITGVYAESGTASTAGGPWTVTLDVVQN